MSLTHSVFLRNKQVHSRIQEALLPSEEEPRSEATRSCTDSHLQLKSHSKEVWPGKGYKPPCCWFVRWHRTSFPATYHFLNAMGEENTVYNSSI